MGVVREYGDAHLVEPVRAVAGRVEVLGGQRERSVPPEEVHRAQLFVEFERVVGGGQPQWHDDLLPRIRHLDEGPGPLPPVLPLLRHIAVQREARPEIVEVRRPHQLSGLPGREEGGVMGHVVHPPHVMTRVKQQHRDLEGFAGPVPVRLPERLHLGVHLAPKRPSSVVPGQDGHVARVVPAHRLGLLQVVHPAVPGGQGRAVGQPHLFRRQHFVLGDQLADGREVRLDPHLRLYDRLGGVWDHGVQVLVGVLVRPLRHLDVVPDLQRGVPNGERRQRRLGLVRRDGHGVGRRQLLDLAELVPGHPGRLRRVVAEDQVVQD